MRINITELDLLMDCLKEQIFNNPLFQSGHGKVCIQNLYSKLKAQKYEMVDLMLHEIDVMGEACNNE